MLPPPLRDHGRNYLFAEQKGCCQMAKDPVLPVFQCDILQQSTRIVDDGIVHHDVHSPESLQGELNQGDNVLLFQAITLLVRNFAAHALCLFEHLLGILRGSAPVTDDN